VRAWGTIAELSAAVYEPLLRSAERINAVLGLDSVDALTWAAATPETASIRVYAMTDGPASVAKGEEAARVLRDLPRDRNAGEFAEKGRAQLLAAAGRGRLAIIPVGGDFPPFGCEVIEVSGTRRDAVLFRERLGSGPSLTERVHVFRAGPDDEHIAAVRADLSTLEAEHSGDQRRKPEDNAVRDPLRAYQRRAVEAWIDADRRGIASLATGTGKTITAQVAAEELASEVRGLVTVVIAPLTHLVDQWVENFRERGMRAIACHSSTAAWGPKASQEIDLVRAGVRPRATLVATYDTFILEAFGTLVEDLAPEHFLFVADEAHHLGSVAYHGRLPDNAGYRLGLTATPRRWGDEVGTERLREYFGRIIAEYTIADAIADGVLAPYRYELHGFELGQDDLSAFSEASRTYADLLVSGRSDRDMAAIERARTRRADVLDTAPGKIEVARTVLRRSRPDRTIIYCAGREQLDAALTLCWGEGYGAQPFTGEEPGGKRRDVLRRFAEGDVPILAAIRCLDEGVDVPSAREAYLLKSSGNPAQYVQRRGRLLRPDPGKEYAVVRDVVPTNGDSDVVTVEWERVREFADAAMNADEAVAQFESITGGVAQ
jgi:superfamily II DNA or RNA helicase